MIISCPACDTRYVVPESAIGTDGRTVRCAKCKHSWFQDPAPLDLTQQVDGDTAENAPANAASEQAPAQEPEPAPAPAPPAPQPKPAKPAAHDGDDDKVSDASAGPSISHWRTEDHPESANLASSSGEGIAARALKQGMGQKTPSTAEAEERDSIEDAFDDSQDNSASSDTDPLAGEGADSLSESADYDFDDTFYEGERSTFDYSPPFTRRRNSLKMWTSAACIFAFLASGTAVAVNYYGLPDWFPVNRPTFGIGKADLELDFPSSQQRKETLDSGEEIFRVRGSIRNTGQESVSVPSLLIVFRDEREKNVYSWVVVPSKSELAPGESLNVTEAVTDIPVSAKAAEIGWSPS